MPISKDLFLAILSMDSYNREYGAGIELGDSSQIGAATILDRESFGIDSTKYQAWQDAGFYAIAYDVDASGVDGFDTNTTVISYRGTDAVPDYTTGWVVSAGLIGDWTQAPQALAFYSAVTGQVYSDGPAANTYLTGHSLGGGLVGYVSQLSGTPGLGVDHMPYDVAVVMQIYCQSQCKKGSGTRLKTASLRLQMFYALTRELSYS